MDNTKYIGHYRVVGELGRGGMGVVYKAHEEELNRFVAIKVLSEQLASHPEVVERFKREAKSMGALNDPHIIQIYLIGEHDGQPFFAMEFVEGESLSQRLKRVGKLSIDESRRILRQTAEGLATAHERGVIHRDIKPGNLMLDQRDRVRIADFGIAMTHDLGDRLTRTGEFVGTPGYLSPEVCMGKEVDARSDIFALGIVFYEMLTGDLPFTDSSPLGMMLEVVKAEIPDVRKVNAEVDDRTYRILTRMIAKDPDDRYQSCQQLAQDLAEGPSTQPGVAAAGATVVTGGSSLPSSPGVTVAMDTPAPRSGPQPAAPPADRQLVATGSRELAVRPTRSRAPMVAAVAAVLLLVAGIGGGYAYRDRLFGGGDKTDQPARVALATGAADDLTSPVAEPDALPSDEELEAALKETLAETAPAAVTPTPAAVTPTPEATTLAAATPTTAEPVSEQAAMSLNAGQPVSLDYGAADRKETQRLPTQTPGAVATAAGETAAAADNQAADPVATVVELSPADVQPGTATSVRPVVESAAPATPQPTVVAKATPSLPAEPRIVVMAVGDPAIAGPIKRMLENKLLGESLDVLDQSFISGLERTVGPDRVDLGEATRIIGDEGGSYLVLAQIDYVGETGLEYYGQYSTLYTVSLDVKTYDVARRRSVGPGIRERIDFTTLNAEQKAKEALSPHLAAIADNLKAQAR